MTQALHSVALEDAINAMPMRGLLLRVPALCGLLMAVDGLDLFAMSYIAPFVSAEFGISPSQMGHIFAATVVSSMLGAIVLTPLTGRLGYRKILLFSMLMTGLGMALTGLAQSYEVLLLTRFMVGIGLGASLPGAVALASEFAPVRHRSKVIMAANSSAVLGLLFIGAASGIIIPAFGWRALVFTGTALSFVCLVVLFLFLPESVRFLMRREPDGARLQKLLRRLSLDAGQLQPPQGAAPGQPALRDRGVALRSLFGSQYARRTFALLFQMAAASSVVNFAGFWMPTIILNQGFRIQAAAVVGPTSQFFATIVILCASWLMDRFGMGRVLSICFAGSALAFGTISILMPMPVVAFLFLMIAMTFLGVCISGSLPLLVSAFDVGLRPTAAGWIMGITRFVGGSVGSLAGGYIIGSGWKAGSIALTMGAVIALAALALQVLLRDLAAPARQPVTLPPAQEHG